MDSATSSAQQFCLRWHNHQASLLSTLPLLLDQSHLTDVTLSAEGKTLRAHRVVLSACSTFFSELFRTLDPSFHPVIVIPGASFGAVVALLTFMYSGEVNVFEEQIPTLLALAETLGIKGLADFSNSSIKSPRTDSDPVHSMPTKEPETSPQTASKVPSPLENFFLKTFHFYPHLAAQPLNFSQTALNKTTEFLAKYQQQCNLMQSVKDNNNIDDAHIDENGNKRISAERKYKDMKKIDRIAETLRTNNVSSSKPSISDSNPLKLQTNNSDTPPTSLILKPPPFPTIPQHYMNNEDLSKHIDNLHKDQTYTPENLSTAESILEKTISSPQHTKAVNSKLYATCFICHKQLSNQYNLRVHLETHQNVRYACNVCSHVSRSKDALRKHVSYRHPGAPSPCESETRRKRAKAMNTTPFPLIKQEQSEQHATQHTQQQFMFLQNQYRTVHSPQTSATSSPTTPTTTEPNIKKESTNSERSDSV